MDRDTASRPRTRTARLLLITALALAAAACSKPAPTGLGVQRVAAVARNLVVTADGAWLAWLDGCSEARSRSLPLTTASCDLRVAPAAGGDTLLVSRATTSLPGAVLASPVAPELAALGDYDYALGSGTLVLWRAGAAPRALAREVTFHGYGADGTLGYVAGGELFLVAPGGEPAKVAGTAGAASFELALPGDALAALVRRRAAAGGELLAVPARAAGGEGAPTAQPIAAHVGDYGFGRARAYAFTRVDEEGAELFLAEARPGAKPEPVAKQVRTFAFSPKGDAIAYVADAVPGKQGALRVRSGGREVSLGKEVGEFRWAAASPRLAWLEGYDPRLRSGAIAAGGLDLPRRTFGKSVTDFELSDDGRFVAFLQQSKRGGYSIDLLLGDAAAPEGTAPRQISQASFGFAFSPDGKWLYYRTRCERNGEACDLERLPPADAAAKPQLVAEKVKSFEFAPANPGRLLLSWKRMDRDALDVAVWDAGKLVKVDTYVVPGSARFLGADAKRVAYLVMQEKRAGVYVAAVPAAP